MDMFTLSSSFDVQKVYVSKNVHGAVVYCRVVVI